MKTKKWVAAVLLAFFVCTMLTPAGFADTTTAETSAVALPAGTYIVPLAVQDSAGGDLTATAFGATIDKQALLQVTEDGKCKMTIRCYAWPLVQQVKVFSQEAGGYATDINYATMGKIGTDWTLQEGDAKTRIESGYVDATFNGLYSDVVVEQTEQEKQQGIARLTFSIDDPEKRIGLMAVLDIAKTYKRGTGTQKYNGLDHLTVNNFLQLNLSQGISLDDFETALNNAQSLYWKEGTFANGAVQEVYKLTGAPVTTVTDANLFGPAGKILQKTATVSAKEDGTYDVTFHLLETIEEDLKPVNMNVVTARAYTTPTVKNYSLMYQVTSQNCFNAEENSFTVNYTKEDLIFGKFLYWDTASTQSSNESAADGAAKHYYTTLILQENEIKDVTLTDEASGISVTASNMILPEDGKLVVEVPDNDAVGSAGVALGTEYDSSMFKDIKIYKVAVQDKDGNAVTIANHKMISVSIQLDENWQSDLMSFYVHEAPSTLQLEAGYAWCATKAVISKATVNNNYVSTSTIQTSEVLNGGMLIWTMSKENTGAEQLQNLEDGVYKAEVVLYKYGGNNVLSMANTGVKHDEALLVKKADNADLYLQLGSVVMLGAEYHFGGIWPYSPDGTILYEDAAEEYDYYYAEDSDELLDNAIYDAYDEFASLKSLKVRLMENNESPSYDDNFMGYRVAVVAPAMASLNNLAFEKVGKTDLSAMLRFELSDKISDVDTFFEKISYEADGTAKPLTYQPSVLKRALGHGQKILNGEGKYADISYSATSLAALQEAVTEGQSYYDTVKGKFISSQEKGAEIKEQADLVEDAIAALEIIGGVDKSLLRAAITEAEEIEADKYSEASYAALQAALEAAKAVEANEDATQSQVDKQLELLQAAIKALVTNVDLKEGQYKIPVRLQNAVTTADSMGNESLNQEAILTVADGEAKLQLEFKPMKFSGFTGYLGYLKAIDESSIPKEEKTYPINYDFLDNMSVTQWFTANDLYNTPSEIAALVAAAEASGDEGDIERAKKIAVCYDDLLAYNTAMGNSSVQYPQLYEMSVDVNNLDSEMWVEVYASVMGELVSAQQVARLMIDWTPYTEESVDTSELAAAQKTAEEMTQDTASNESWQALQKAIAAATELLKPETKKSQVQVDAQLALLNAAIAAVKAEQGLSTDALDSAIAEAEELLTDDAYTDVSLAALQAVKEAAAAISADTSNEVAQADINAAVAAVKTAMDALVLKSSQKEVAVSETVPVTLQNENGGIATASSVLQNEAEIVAVDEEAGMATLQLHFQTITIGSTTAGSLGWVTTGSAYGYTFNTESYSGDYTNDNSYLDENGNRQYYVKSATVEIPVGTGQIPVNMYLPKLPAVVTDQDSQQNYVIAVDWSNYLAASDAALYVLSEAVADVQQVLNAYQTIENSGLEAVSDKVWDALAAVQKAGVALGGDANRATNDDAVTKTEATSAADQDAYDTAEALCAVLQLVRVKAPIISVEGYDSSNAINADGNEQLSVTISKNGDATDVIRYSTSDDIAVRDYSGTLTLSGLLQKVRLSAYAATSQYPVRQSNLAYIDINFGEAAEEPTPDNPSGDETPGTNGSTGGSDNTNEKNNYLVPVTLYNAYKEESSMGWVAFANVENALWVENSNGTYDVQVATNPVNVSGYISAITSISSDDYSITSLEYGNIETSTKFDGTVHNVNYVSMFEISNVPYGTKYIKVQFEVPYTPMEILKVDLGARLYFDWSGAEATSDDSLSASAEIAKGATDILSESVDITDDATGVRLVAEEDVLPDGTALTVDAITSGSSFDTASKALDGIAEAFKLYNIVVKADGEEVEPSTTVKLYLPIPSDYDSSKVAVYRINDDGTKVVVKGTVEDGKYVIETKTFGLYAVALTDTVQQVVVNTTYDEAVAKVVAKYPDINNHWAASSIAFVVNRGLMGSVADEQFGPNLQLTRGMLVTILGRLEGFDASKYAGKSSFSDVSTAAWYAAAVQWAAEQGIVSGIGDGKFAPEQAITREQLAAILTNYASYKDIQLKNGPSIKFADSSKISPWAKEAMDAMVKAGIIRGNADGTLNPQGTATRAETAAMLQRFIVNYVDAPVEQDAAQV